MQDVSTSNVASVIVAMHRTLRAAAVSGDAVQRFELLKLVGDLDSPELVFKRELMTIAMSDMPTPELVTATVAAAVRSIYCGAVTYPELEKYVHEIIDTYPADLAERCAFSFETLDDPRKNLAIMSTGGWHDLAMRWFRRDKKAATLGEYRGKAAHVFLGINFVIDGLPKDDRRTINAARKGR